MAARSYLWGLAATVAVGIAFLRGSYFLGAEVGGCYALLTAGVLWLLASWSRHDGEFHRKRAVLGVAFASPIAFALAFPAVINSDVQHFIDLQATDRAVTAEIRRVLRSDPAYAGLSVSTERRKVINVTVRGQVHRMADAGLLKNRVRSECPTLDQCSLHWEIVPIGVQLQ